MLIAYTRAVSETLAQCELTHLPREPLDVGRAKAEHQAYEELLTRLGATVRHLPPEPGLPDAVFVEDTAVVLDEIAIIAHPGASSRRPETHAVEATLALHRPLARIEGTATLDGGDVLVAGHRVYVGLSTRTNHEAVDQMTQALTPYGYEVIPVEFSGCLHLKSGVTCVADDVLLLNPAWVDIRHFKGFRAVHVDPGEPHAANALRIGTGILHPSHYPSTRARLEAEGLVVTPLAMTELAKAEAGVTCCSLLVRVDLD
jgi:dimethylargininase